MLTPGLPASNVLVNCSAAGRSPGMVDAKMIPLQQEQVARAQHPQLIKLVLCSYGVMGIPAGNQWADILEQCNHCSWLDLPRSKEHKLPDASVLCNKTFAMSAQCCSFSRSCASAMQVSELAMHDAMLLLMLETTTCNVSDAIKKLEPRGVVLSACCYCQLFNK